MSFINRVLASVADAMLYPFEALTPLAGLAAVSLLSTVAALLTVRATSDQARLVDVKRAIQACIFEVRLFNDDARAMLRAMGEMLRHNLTYLRLSLVPLLWMIVPFGLFLGQLQFHYGYAGLEPGRAALVKVRLSQSPGPEPTLEAPAGIRIETPAVWIPSLHEAVWRITVEWPGDYDLKVRLGEEIFTKSVTSSSRIVRRSPVRVAGFFNQLLYPAEPPLPGGGIESITVTYPSRGVRVLGHDVHWLVVFLALSTVFALALRAPLKVVL